MCSDSITGCRRLAGVLSDCDALPDHICEATMRLACLDWQQASTSPGYVLDPALTMLPFMDNHAVQLVPWPVVIDAESDIYMVVRQWVQEPADQILSSKVALSYAQYPGWKSAMADVQMFVSECKKRSADPPDVKVVSSFVEEMVRDTLNRNGVTTTQALVRHAASTAMRDAGFGLEVYDPARGALLTSMVVRRPRWTDANGRVYSQLNQQVAVIGDDVSSALHDRLRSRMRAHRQLLTGLPALTFASGDLRRWNGSHDVELRNDIVAHLAGEVNRQEVLARAVNRLRARMGAALSPLEKNRERKRVNTSIWRARKNGVADTR